MQDGTNDAERRVLADYFGDKFEYVACRVTGELVAGLNKLGDDGWEAFFVEEDKSDGKVKMIGRNDKAWKILAKRRKMLVATI
jgi:hypothetical protein